MYEVKYYIIFISALIPLVIGFVWYNPKVFGTVWMKESGITEDKMKGANMGLIFFLSYVFAVLMSFTIMGLSIHQLGFQSMLLEMDGWGDPESPLMKMFNSVIAEHGNNYRTFKHGMLHGFFAGLTIAFTVLATNALFERKSWKYIWINSGYWIVSMMLMGGVICQFA